MLFILPDSVAPIPKNLQNDEVELTPRVERALYLMLCDKELRRLDPLGTIASKWYSLYKIEQLLADGTSHMCFQYTPTAARDRLLDMATEYMSNAGMCADVHV
jgi:hypothetical protein